VTVFDRCGELVLASGDYVYHDQLHDTNRDIVAFHSSTFKGVVVPHHGDLASAHRVVMAQRDATAFFSAGTHQGYRHPTIASINSHSAMGFVVVNNHRLRDIRRVTLL
jgi:beta-lactamase superfamily II metal-dependent hydrolase